MIPKGKYQKSLFNAFNNGRDVRPPENEKAALDPKYIVKYRTSFNHLLERMMLIGYEIVRVAGITNEERYAVYRVKEYPADLFNSCIMAHQDV